MVKGRYKDCIVKVLKMVSSLNISYVLVYELNDIVVHEYPFNSYTFYLDYYVEVGHNC